VIGTGFFGYELSFVVFKNCLLGLKGFIHIREVRTEPRWQLINRHPSTKVHKFICASRIVSFSRRTVPSFSCWGLSLALWCYREGRNLDGRQFKSDPSGRKSNAHRSRLTLLLRDKRVSRKTRPGALPGLKKTVRAPSPPSNSAALAKLGCASNIPRLFRRKSPPLRLRH